MASLIECSFIQPACNRILNKLIHATGLLTIGPRFGGAIDDAARYFKDAYDRVSLRLIWRYYNNSLNSTVVPETAVHFENRELWFFSSSNYVKILTFAPFMSRILHLMNLLKV